MCEWIHLVRVCVLTGAVCMAGMPCGAEDAAARSERIDAIERMLRGETGDLPAVKLWDASIPRESRADRRGAWHSESAGMSPAAEVVTTGETERTEPGIVPVNFVPAEMPVDKPSALIVQSPATAAADSLAATGAVGTTDSENPEPVASPGQSLTPKSNSQPAADGSGVDPGTPAWMKETSPQTLDLGELIGRLVIATGMVLVLAVLAVVAVRKWMGPTCQPGVAESSRLRLVEALALPQRASLQLVELDGRPVLVGMNSGGLQSITPVERSFSESLYAMNQDAEAHIQEESGNERTPDVDERCDTHNSSMKTAEAPGSWTEMIAESLNLKSSPTAGRNLKAG